ncbi:enoyl-CoA hydratase [Beggiatoa leptomitoformis]|uniref:enoyl-CoA hydratase n=1 Tax=Beggiatoa leptomitoformis TaxID=288004 RepID=A0A2N9YFP8_9GAMM|nr:enoyl-CoA hydratase [Beggiatoa leptomitoformis]ALG68383.1 enoyl-CoA hydratase [Beggiatoa leptomitoformis]AUI69293.1 enoyl-CoA hydratase [Beggiatoa leptomitoformis]
MDYNNILLEIHDNIALIKLNRPKALNALSPELMQELTDVLDRCEADPAIHVMVLTGNEKAFAAGADIKAMKDFSYMDAYKQNFITRDWERLTRCRKPVIAAVAGYALGGGCEVAMMCDFIIAAENAKFGQPEINLGIIPGAGGTQRLTRLIGKSKAMEMCLTGRLMDAQEAERAGLVSRIVPTDKLLAEVMNTAAQMAKLSQPVVMMAKECVNRAYESSLTEGLLFERRVFHATFALEDQKEGMSAFIEKRTPNFNHQ